MVKMAQRDIVEAQVKKLVPNLVEVIGIRKTQNILQGNPDQKVKKPFQVDQVWEASKINTTKSTAMFMNYAFRDLNLNIIVKNEV